MMQWHGSLKEISPLPSVDIDPWVKMSTGLVMWDMSLTTGKIKCFKINALSVNSRIIIDTNGDMV